MKIGLLSFHNAANYGAAMQAFALQKYLENQGYVCEYLDYVNYARKNAYSMSNHIFNSLKAKKISSAIKYAIGSPFLELRKFRFSQFYKRYLRLSSQTYTTAETAKAWEPLYDKFIVGSDQVWCAENNGNDMAFLLSFVADENKKVSYSSSFGIPEIPTELKKDYVRCLNGIKYISTREQFGCDLIKELTGRDAQLVMDPVFLLSVSEWNKLIPVTNKEKFIFSYTNSATQLPEFLKKTNYPLDGKRIYKLSSQTSPSDFFDSKVKVMYTMAPQKFLQSIRDAEFVVTASFHCLAFSIIFHKPFAVMLAKGQNIQRLQNLLSLFGLSDRIITDDTKLHEIQKPIDWDYVDKILNVKRDESIAFLTDALSK